MSSDENTGDQEAPKIEFPCLYPIKIIGVASPDFQDEVICSVEKFTGKISAELIEINPSKNTNYVSVRLTIAATGIEQLDSIFTELKTNPNVKMVL